MKPSEFRDMFTDRRQTTKTSQKINFPEASEFMRMTRFDQLFKIAQAKALSKNKIKEKSTIEIEYEK